MKSLSLLCFLAMTIGNALGQTVTFDYLVTPRYRDPNNCPCHFRGMWEADVNSAVDANSNPVTGIETIASHGCIDNTINGLVIGANNTDQGTHLTGAGFVIKMNFVAGVQYKIKTIGSFFSVPASPSRPPKLQVRMSNTFTTGTLCTVSSPPIDISSTTDPYGEFSYNGQIILFSPTQCYQYLWLSCKPNPTWDSWGAIWLQKLSIEAVKIPEIAGNDVVCNSQTYTLGYYPTGSTISWSVNPTGIANISSVANSATLSKITSGSVTLKATVVSSCSTYVTTKEITVGTVQPSGISFPLIDPDMGRIQAVASPVLGATSYNWYCNGSDLSFYSTGSVIQFPIARECRNTEYDVSVEAVNACGISNATHANAAVYCDYYLLSSNSATKTVQVSADDTKLSKGRQTSKIGSSIFSVRISNLSGASLKQISYDGKKSVSINIADLSSGTYVVNIFDGSKWYSKLINIK